MNWISKENEIDPETEAEFKTATMVLNHAIEEGLLPEVIIWALRSMKYDPKQTIPQALMDGYYEWIK